MKMMIDFSFPLEPFNTFVRNGTAGQKTRQVLEDLQPEVVYFSERGGKRGGIMIVDLADPSKVPAIAEPLFLTFDASVKFHVVMTPEELERAGLDELGQRYS